MKTIENMLHEILLKKTHPDIIDGDNFAYKMCVDRDEKLLSKFTLRQIFNSSNPRETFNEILNNWANDATPYMAESIIDMLSENTNIDTETIAEYVALHCEFYYDPADFDETYPINIMIDTGDADYCFTCNNALNYYGDWRADLVEPSSILWLSDKMGKRNMLNAELTRINKYISKNNDSHYNKSDDTFIASVIQELENNTCSCSALILLANMSLSKFFELKDAMLTNPAMKLTVSKDSTCGLFDINAGGGSVLEIELSSDLTLDASHIYDIWIDGAGGYKYDVNDVYGLCNNCWDGTITISTDASDKVSA
ncbi:hypothetical protein J6A31_06100 [bacterium]|nr:hypothetical protein [bacterium]